MPDSQTELEAASPATESNDVKPATESSTAESSAAKDVPKKSMLDAVKDALKVGSDDSSKSDLTPETNEGTAAKVAGAKEEADDGDIPPEEMKLLTRNVQRRFHVLTASRKAAEEKAAELAPKAEAFEQVSKMMTDNGLSKEDVDSGYAVMVAIKKSPEKALEMLAPIVRKLMDATGHKLPEDLRAEVESGAITEARARELSIARSRATHLEKSSEEKEQQRQAEETQRKTKAVVDDVVKSADAWHAERAKTDPDWHWKQQRVIDAVELQIRKTGKFPQSDKEARGLFDEVLKAVETDLKRFLPKKAAIAPVSGGASPGAKAEPKTMLEAMKQAAAH